MRLFSFGIVFMLVSSMTVAPVNAADFNYKLKGDYFASHTRVCILSGSGFNDQLQPIGGGTSYVSIVENTYHYDGKGSFMLSGRTLSPGPGGTTPGNLSTFNCTGTYQVDANGHFTEQAACSSENVKPSTPGVNSTVNSTLSGYVRGTTVVYSDTSANIENVTINSPQGTSSVFRLCARSGTGQRIN